MKKLFVTLLALLLALATVLSLCACGGESEGTGETTSVSAYKSKGEYQTLNKQLTWEALNEFPVVSDSTTIEEGRKMVVDFFRYCKTALWIPDTTYEYKIKTANTESEVIQGGVTYGGLPYISLASGSIYRLMDYMDESTGVVDVLSAGLKPTLFGNQCSFGSYWGYGRVINSADYNWTKNMTLKNGFLRLGDYTYDDTLEKFSESRTTTQILEAHGKEKMFECYALLKAGDGIMYYTTAGHVVMISGDAVVQRDASGKIDPAKSYVTVIDQTPGHNTATNDAGDTYAFENNVDAKWTFTKLFNGNYIPFTFAEWLGTDPIEASKTEYSHTGESITKEQLFKSKVTSNYGMSDIYAVVYDAKGNEVYKAARRAEESGMKELNFKENGFEMDFWGDLDELKDKKGYTVKIIAQVSTGERPTLWEGKLDLK